MSDLAIVTVLSGDGETDARTLQFLPDGKTLVEAVAGGELTLWHLDPDSWKQRACDVAGRRLTEEERIRYIPEAVSVDPC